MEPVATPRVFSQRYELTHLIARGGMAQVYLATDRLLDRPVALKVLFPELSVDLAFVERFRREAQAAANLVHPNIIQVFDWGEDQGAYFIVMEFVDGRSLATTLRETGRLHPTEAAVLGAKVASGLAYAHRRGVVHRDVKPGNILLTATDEVKIGDFGIARAVNAQDNLTQSGSVMGTATYFSPEQAQGISVDARSDLYSLGVVLFEMLAGRAPYLGDSPVAVAAKHVHDPVPHVRDVNPAVPAAMDAIVAKAMAKAPADRYPSAEDLRADLLRFVEGRPVLAESSSIAEVPTGEVPMIEGAGDGSGGTGAIPALGVPYERPPVRRNSRPSWLLPVIGAAALILVLGGYFAWKSLQPSDNLTVPVVTNSSVQAATATLLQAGFTVTGETKVGSATVKAGFVVNTNPAAGRSVPRGTPLELEISVGNQKQVAVPNLVGYSVADAQQALSGLGLNSVINYIPSPDQQGAVITTNPAAGDLVWTGSTVTLNLPVVNNPKVPYVINMTPAQAGSTIGAAGFSVGSTTSACSNTTTSGFVSATSPPAGTQLPSGSSVSLTISTGICQVTVPNVVGQNQGPAIQQLTAAGLQTQTTTYTGGASCTASSVVATTPSAGTSVPYDSTVTLQICPATVATTTTPTTTPGVTTTTG